MAPMTNRAVPIASPKAPNGRGAPYEVGVLSVLPSPYQHDLFTALARRPEIDLSVYYQEEPPPESPWSNRALEPYASALPGFCVGVRPHRIHVNWNLPDFNQFDLVILNTSYLSTATQWLMRGGLNRETPWVYWTERLRWQDSTIKRCAQQMLTAPLERAEAIVVIGTLARRQYQERFPDQRVVNIPYHCDLSAYRHVDEQTVSGDEVVFLFCGQMIYRKGVDLLLQAFEALVADGLNVRLVLVGPEADLPEMMGEIGPQAQARISFEGFQDPDDLPQYFGRADVFVLPSRHDGWGVVVNEALGAGLPLICSEAVGAAHDLIEDGENGCRVPAGNPRALRSAMRRVVENQSLRRRWKDNSRKKISGWTVGEGARKWVKVISETLERVS